MVDASIGTNGNAGYGFWCVSDRSSCGGGNILNGYVKDSYEGESKAVVNSLYECIYLNHIRPKDTVLIQIDNRGVISLLSGLTKFPRKDITPIKKLFDELLEEFDLYVNFRHVKAHTDNMDNRSRSNSICDKIAYEYMTLSKNGKVKQTKIGGNINA